MFATTNDQVSACVLHQGIVIAARPDSSTPESWMTVGVAIPSYLGANLITPTLQSLISQTHEDWFAVVVNDGVEDGTCSAVETIGDARIRYVCDGRHRGQFGNFNRAIIEVLKRDPAIVRLLCADDVLYPYALSDMLRVFNCNPTVGLVSTHYDGICANGQYRFRVRMENRNDLVMSGRDYLWRGVAVGNAIGGPSCVGVRREAFDTAGLFDTRINHSGEADLWHRIAAQWDVAWVGHRPGLQYRFHDASITGRGKHSRAKFTDPIQIVRRVAATEPIGGWRWWIDQYTIGRLHSINLMLIGAMARRGNWDAVREALVASWQEGVFLYSFFWLPRIPWQLFQIVFGRPPASRVLWRREHDRLQPHREPA